MRTSETTGDRLDDICPSLMPRRLVPSRLSEVTIHDRDSNDEAQ
jgi:hypothetical protein